MPVGDWVHLRTAGNGSSQTINANTHLELLRWVVLDSTEECTVKDLSMHFHFQRGNATYARITVLALPDDVYANIATMDLTTAAAQDELERFMWLEHTFFFGTSTTNGVASMNLDLKTGTLRRIGAYDKIVVCVDVQDIENVQSAALMGYNCDYYYQSKG